MASRPHTVKHLSLVVSGWLYSGRNRRRVATVAAAVLAVALGYHVVFGRNGLTAYNQKRHTSVLLSREIGALNHENDLLRARVAHLQDDPAAIEVQAREQLHYTRPGEVIYGLPVAPPK